MKRYALGRVKQTVCDAELH